MDRRALFNRIRKISSTFFFLALLLVPFSLLLTPAPVHASTSTTVYGPSTLYTGMVGWWTMDGKDTNWSTNITSDNSGKSNNLPITLLSTTSSPTSGKIGQGLNFDGSSQYIWYPSASGSTNITLSLTVSVWFRPSVNPSGRYGLLNRGVFSSAPNQQYGLSLYSNNIYFGVSDGTTQYQVTLTDSAIKANTWYLATGVYDSSAKLVELYRNGVLIATSSAPAAIQSVTSGY
ncbi:MAG: LamG domain-containing protein, partial [Patescibacteria group bacterium]|nr:LamG domain-containing protein [Patescibacteria group bacterium]